MAIFTFSFQEPLETKLGEKVIETVKNSLPYFKRVPEYLYEVPFLLSLQSFLSDPFILEEVCL